MFTKITYFNSPIPAKIFDDQILNELLLNFDNLNIPIIENILIVFGNLLVDDRKLILQSTDLVVKLDELLLKYDLKTYKAFLNSKEFINISLVMFWNFSIILDSMSIDEIKYFGKIIPNIMTPLSNENIFNMKEHDKNQEELLNILKTLYILSRSDDNCILMIDSGIPERLVYLLQYVNTPYVKNLKFSDSQLIVLNTENLKVTLNIVSNLFAIDNNLQLNLSRFNHDFIEIFESIMKRYKLFHKDDRPVLMEAIWCLGNMATCSPNEVDCLSNSFIPEALLSYYMKEEQVISCILNFFNNLLDDASSARIIRVLKLNFFQKLCESFKNINNPDTIIVSLKNIEKIVIFIKKTHEELYGKNPFAHSKSNPVNFIIDSIENNNVTTRLEQLAIHNNKEISVYAESLLKTLENMIQEYRLN